MSGPVMAFFVARSTTKRFKVVRSPMIQHRLCIKAHLPRPRHAGLKRHVQPLRHSIQPFLGLATIFTLVAHALRLGENVGATHITGIESR